MIAYIPSDLKTVIIEQPPKKTVIQLMKRLWIVDHFEIVAFFGLLILDFAIHWIFGFFAGVVLWHLIADYKSLRDFE